MSASGLSARQRAAEGMYFASEERLAIGKYLERQVAEGKIARSVLERFRASQEAGPPTTKLRGNAEFVFNYTPGVSKLPPRASYMTHFGELGTQVSLGRGRWSSDNTSIFSVSDGKRLAQTPPKPLNNYEAIRQTKIVRAQLESPQVAGLRLLPKFTPGRALFWGSVLAAWGTAATVASAARHLGIGSWEEAGPRLREARLAPLRDTLAFTDGKGFGAEVQRSETVRRLRDVLGGKPAAA
ncbi:hypothetical protein QBZ16_005394 [Prototheca wickerhamii]|uniref:Uncharacterized protein n=1 Tax=Prototheca wickerhamii TaxID=3111 RepID=A0AAD9MGD9_PROWI|nr:hypothetical protein QBZ16_005394 [Prototheca wickerhamii]